MYISLLLDVEDLIAPEADDIAMWCADIFRDEGTPATFCVVGEKARLFASRGRRDVIASLNRHDIGLHSDQHSVHPTICEYLGARGWEDGIAEAMRREGPGVASIRQVFGRTPSTFAGPGATWGPQIHAAMRALGVPAVVYAHTAAPEGRGVHRFAGTRSYPRRDFADMVDYTYRDPAAWRSMLDANLAKLEGFRAAGYEWAGVFMGHPTHILHHEFWDAANLANGQTVPREHWIPPTRISDAELAIALENVRATAAALRRLPGVEIKTIAEMNALYDRRAARPVRVDERETMWERIRADVAGMREWPILPQDFSTAQIEAQTRAQLHTIEREALV